jgi:hypothetical protein
MKSRPGRRDPFRALGLEPHRGLGDDDIRAAWRRVAAASHPDRADGGDPAAFAAAAAAYAVLRTPAGRGEALADLLAPGGTVGLAGNARARRPVARLRSAVVRIWQGRPVILGLRVLLAVAVCAVAVAAAGWQPATLAILAGLATWLLRTAGSDVAPPR